MRRRDLDLALPSESGAWGDSLTWDRQFQSGARLEGSLEKGHHTGGSCMLERPEADSQGFGAVVGSIPQIGQLVGDLCPTGILISP